MPARTRSARRCRSCSDVLPGGTPSPQTRRPREDSEFGAGYDAESPGIRNRIGENDLLNVSPRRERSMHDVSTSEDERSDGGGEWRGWGVNPNNNTDHGNVSDSDSTVDQPAWKGWGVNP